MIQVDEDSGPVIAYFILLGSSLAAVLGSWAPLFGKKFGTWNVGEMLALPLAATSLYICWGAIFGFMMEVSRNKGCGKGESPVELMRCNTPEWKEFDVFVQAYVDVSNNAVGWASSSQLLMFVLSGCTFLHMECARLGVSRLIATAYVLVGFLGAISLAFPLLFAHLYSLAREKQTMVPCLTFSIGLSNLLALCGVLLLPLTCETHRRTIFTWALMLVHFVLGMPCIVGRPTCISCGSATARRESIKLGFFYIFLAGLSLAVHLSNVFRAGLQLSLENPSSNFLWLAEEIVFGPFRNSLCQFSISFDVVFTSIAAMAYMVGTEPKLGSLLALATPFISVAASFPCFLALEILTQQNKVGK